MVGNLHHAGQNGGFQSFLADRRQADGLPERLLDAVLAEQRRDWIAGERIPADERLRQHPELAAEPACAAELIYHEFCVAAGAGRVRLIGSSSSGSTPSTPPCWNGSARQTSLSNRRLPRRAIARGHFCRL